MSSAAPNPLLHRHSDDPHQGFIGLVASLAEASGPDGLTIGEIRDRLDERAFGLMILILAIPCLVPALYGVPQIVGVPILLLAGQMLAGREEPWLPAGMLKRTVSKSMLDRMADFAVKRMGWLERLSKPRLRLFTTGLAERMAAAFMILATLTIVLPMTNTVPSVALALLAVGLIQRDGLFVAAGATVAVGWATAIAVVATGFLLGAGWAVGLMARFTG
ncbi:exopolysaccharide biosynthesis protein exod [Brevundimonas sp. AAP58]|uniref:exopolysaccharide biosynthesis protein n=1 Tax=Brevundimonas sp. AAP58 TaxID=1523422 RepID=UPI0006B912B3|nr:exopolysaccharide biosynthesis protein [Brevundimonas sp. AAP58]KPF81867.1 exopolysaccharide biosynthesis protein exod [Brevundimonas sp. AAP58]